MRIRGIGLKTGDYMKNLSGIPTVAVDRHIRKFVKEAGVSVKRYEEVRQIVEYAADLLSIERNRLDRAICLYNSGVTRSSHH
jgi:endonuclease III